MIDVHEAVKAASNFLKTVLGEVSGLQVEEVEVDESQNDWLITLSFFEELRAVTTINPFAALGMVDKQPRVYKIFRIDGNDGHVKSMKIRKL